MCEPAKASVKVCPHLPEGILGHTQENIHTVTHQTHFIPWVQFGRGERRGAAGVGEGGREEEGGEEGQCMGRKEEAAST